MRSTRTRFVILAAMTLAALPPRAGAGQGRITIHADQPGAKVPRSLYGIFFEDINSSADGGLYAEMVRNRSFEDSDRPDHWSVVGGDSGRVHVRVAADRPVSPNNLHSLRVEITRPGTGQVGVANDGYAGMSLVREEVYRLSLQARGGENFTGPLTVTLESRAGVVHARGTIEPLAPEWRSYHLDLKAAHTDPEARLVIRATGPGTFWLDMVSLFPEKTWKGRANGLRTDLAEMLNGLRPGFMRFPGGCWVEGETIPLAYRWKQTVGDISRRRTQYNLWKYMATNGLGFHEYLQLCEDLGAEPLFVINCGMAHGGTVPMKQMGEFVQDALDAIEYANGPADSRWGSIRAGNGHPAPFHLKYMEVGNENGGQAYQERYALFYDAIKARYPEVKLIADEPVGSRPADLVDEHYYNGPGFFIANADKYDSYDRKGPKIYVGEYAVTTNCGQGNLRGALAEAAFMTGLERNADVVAMASYAPLFANVHDKAWNPDLINFDSSRVYGTPSYYVQQLFARNRADVVLPVQMEAGADTPVPVNHGAIGLATWGTQAEYKDIKVTRGDKVLFAPDFARGTEGWQFHGGRWKVQEGALQQAEPGSGLRATAGDPTWTDYTVSVKARKLAGAEGFLVMVHVQDKDNWIWWNVGGVGNTVNQLECYREGSPAVLGRPVPGKVETGRWYDLRVELQGTKIRCFLDSRLVQEATYKPPALSGLHAVAGRVEATGEIVLKVVNVSSQTQETQIHLESIPSVQPKVEAVVLTSADLADENSLAEPRKVCPVTATIPNAGPDFRYQFPANSLTVLRFKVGAGRVK